MLNDLCTHASFLDLGNLVNRAHPLAEGLLCWWLVIPQLTGGTRFRDLMGKAHGALVGMAASPTATSGWSRVTSRAGGFGEVRFGGTDDKVTTGFTFNNTTYTQAVWVLIPTLPVAGVMSLFGNDGGVFDGHNLSVDSVTPGTLIIHNCHPSACNDISSTGAITAGVWTHVAVAVAAGVATFYINGQAAGGGSSVEGFGLAWELGGDGHNPNIDLLIGRLDDARIYGRALSPAEILALYVNSRQGYPGLLNRLPLFPQAPLVSFPGGDEGALWYHSVEAA